MAHNLFSSNMAFVGELPWHGLGIELSAGVSGQEMLKAAKLNWQVSKVPATGARPLLKPGGEPAYDRDGNRAFERYFITRECLDGEKEPPVLGIVRSGYEILQNDEAFAFFEPFLSAGHASYETAGALGNGERVWVQVRVGDPIVIADDDKVEKFLLLSNSHDGSRALSLRFTPVRVVCQNTLNLATKDGGHVVNIRHSKNIRDRLADEQVHFLLRLVQDTFARAAVQFATLARTKANATLREKYLTALFPPTKSQAEKRETPKWWDGIDQVLANPTVTPPKTRDTMWGLYNAVTRAEDYRETTEASGEARLDRVWFGRGADMKLRALDQALELCEA